jgi:hypothetical protein
VCEVLSRPRNFTHLGNFDFAEKESSEALKILFQWELNGTKEFLGQVGFPGHEHSKEKDWPKTSFGMINLGKVNL